MKHHIIKSIAALAMGALLLTGTVGCDPDDMFDIHDTIPTDTVPQEPEPFSLTGTAWMMVQDEWWSSTLHYIDTSIWRFQTDSTGTFSEHFIYNDNDPLGVEIYPMTYTFDTVTLEGTLYGYEHPLEFTYHPEDTTITYDGRLGTYTYHRLTE